MSTLPIFENWIQNKNPETIDNPYQSQYQSQSLNPQPISTSIQPAKGQKEISIKKKYVQKPLLTYTIQLWKRVGVMLVFLFIILTALSINALIQTILSGLSPAKQYSSIILIILSQALYTIVVTIGLISAFLLVARQDFKNSQDKPRSG